MTSASPRAGAGALEVRVGARFVVTGVVQGVGFRPFVYRLASELGLGGLVGNDSAEVFVEVHGTSHAVDELERRLAADAPALAIVDEVRRTALAPCEVTSFRIVESRIVPGVQTWVAPDAAVCDECVSELFDPGDRRYRHPFITCTNCGPRYTIITSLPYDRPNTTMAAFPMCPACASEYEDPGDRRFHAQPVACPSCGPTLVFTGADGLPSPGDPIGSARATIDRGGIVAIKGIGGFHLACDATSDATLAALRERKHRVDKPFAVMAADLAAARVLAEIDDLEADLLSSSARPIVLVRARPTTPLSVLVAPGNPLVGVMLPYTPVHHLLFATDRRPLVMTSANRGGEPICTTSSQVEEQLGHVVDGVLDHDREIAVPCDDSVVRVVDGALMPIRRARGYAPLPVSLPHARVDVLAVGGELKNTCCVTTGGQAWMSQHLGDMENLATLEAFEACTARFLSFYGVRPQVVAVDAHPRYLTSSWARRRHPDRVVEIQHHHAHVAAVMAEHRLHPDQRVVGIAFDGTGYGSDGTIWGGEVLVADASAAERVAHLRPILLPGGDAAVHHPCRLALAHLRAADLPWLPTLPAVAAISDGERQLLSRQLDTGFACVPTTSMGRLFDAVGSLVGLRHHITYEAQGAIELEVAATQHGGTGPQYRFELAASVIDPRPVLAAIVADLQRGTAVGAIALGFHHAVARAVEAMAIRVADAHGLDTVALTGGVFQNALLTTLVRARLARRDLRVLTHRLVPANDGGLALGQAYIAAHRTAPDRRETET